MTPVLELIANIPAEFPAEMLYTSVLLNGSTVNMLDTYPASASVAATVATKLATVVFSSRLTLYTALG